MKLFISCCFVLMFPVLNASAQTDSSYKSQPLNQFDHLSPVQQPFRLFSTYNSNEIRAINQRRGGKLVRPDSYKEAAGKKFSGTVLELLGIACLIVWGHKTNRLDQYPYFGSENCRLGNNGIKYQNK